MKFFFFLLLSFNFNICVKSLPDLLVDGFSWAENLIFDDKYDNLFVSDAVQGKLYRIYLCENQTQYCKDIHIDNRAVSQIGGLVISDDKDYLYAGATFNDKSKGIIHVSIAVPNKYSILTRTEHQPNGFVGDWVNKILYYTDEGTGSPEGGTVNSFNMQTNVSSIAAYVPSADGLYIDEKTQKIYCGELIDKKIHVFTASSSGLTLDNIYPGLSLSLNKVHLLDDLSLYGETNSADMERTVLLGADWTGKSVQKFQLDGKLLSTIKGTEGGGVELYEVTSVRYGKGKSFDSKSIYVTEGGGATTRVTNRRVVQIKNI